MQLQPSRCYQNFMSLFARQLTEKFIPYEVVIAIQFPAPNFNVPRSTLCRQNAGLLPLF